MKKNKNFKKLKHISMVDQVSDQILDLISSGTLQVGDKLPAEAELAENYDVNRLTVRMALQKLQTIGVVETRVGEGSFVKELRLSDILKEVPVSAFSNYCMEDIVQFRRTLDMEAAKLAIARATAEDLEILKQFAERATSSFPVPRPIADRLNTGDIDEMVDRDMEFHRGLCVCSHNALLLDIFDIFSELIRENIISVVLMREEARIAGEFPISASAVNIHMSLYEAIAAKDWKTAKKLCVQMPKYDYPQNKIGV